MKLIFLNINFQSSEEFFKSVESSFNSKQKIGSIDNSTLFFDSEKTFNNMFTFNKLQILRAVSQFNPDSIYKLANFLGREPQHVLKDCRLLETLKFLILEEATVNGRATLKPKLTFNYDVIKVHSKSVQPFTISTKAERLITEEDVDVAGSF